MAPLGDASSRTASTGKPSSRSADTSGSETVADAKMNVGVEPYFAQTRRSRRSTAATCDPKTPRYEWHSSTTTYVSALKNWAHRAWLGKSERCSMSGFVSTYDA